MSKASRRTITTPSAVRRGRKTPPITDHEVLCCIGRGSFGEVWLAKAITGSFRAIKVIWRENFESEKDFEREFEAIKRYEPISRQHPGLVDILQVGREDKLGFYYYIMEVADDIHAGQDIDPIHYTPLTFRSYTLERDGIDLQLCAEQGAYLADALHFLHQNNLIHRDVKLSNVILVKGQPKLADIGLVAAMGDQSFVGTEGYVPPEGAGKVTSDIYSLGMVIYELSTGKDRLDFPDVPSDFRERTDRDLWRRINKVVCRACARRVESRYRNADELAHALRGEESLVPAGRWQWLVGLGAAAMAGVIIMIASLFQKEPEQFVIKTEPPNAEVVSGDRVLGRTPLYFPTRPQEGVSYEIRLEGFRKESIEYAGATDPRRGLNLNLEPTKFPQPGFPWENSMGLKFQAVSSGHRLEKPIHADIYRKWAIEHDRYFEAEVTMFEKDGDRYPIPIVSAREARAFADWMQAKDQAEGFIAADYVYRLANLTDPGIQHPNARLTYGRQFIAINPFTIYVEKRSYGRVAIRSNPSGARVFKEDGEELGVTPYENTRVRTGAISYELRLDGHKPYYFDGVVESNSFLQFDANLEQGQGVEFDKAWKNSLGMEFRPVNDILVSQFETRVQDYRQFCDASRRKMPARVEETSQDSYPIDGVSREDAEAFCDWLTKYERQNGSITARHGYRLPTDVEWSFAAGLPKERATTPAQRNGFVEGVYPWGYEWPPPPISGNFADESLLSHFTALSGESSGNVPGPEIIAGYDDTFEGLAWVTEFNPNDYGLHNMSGNVWEWVSDNYYGGGGGLEHTGTIRGGSWETAERRELLTSYRRSLDATVRLRGVGFRCVLARVTPAG